ncbi:MAG: Peptidase [Alphaproteobacteria bacterium]|jgi:tetratricopeptide (TPR) repeat protein|nr:Peptidase [Alphaproteobacteria bacterium]
MIGRLSASGVVVAAMLVAVAPAPSWAQYNSFEDACAGETHEITVNYACGSFLAERKATGRKLAWGHANRGWARFMMVPAKGTNDYGPALADFEAALKIDPKLAYPLYGRGMVRLRQGDVARGNADIAAATKAQPDIARQFEKPMKRP